MFLSLHAVVTSLPPVFNNVFIFTTTLTSSFPLSFFVLPRALEAPLLLFFVFSALELASLIRHAFYFYFPHVLVGTSRFGNPNDYLTFPENPSQFAPFP